jgi:hypothetical protein
MGMENEALEREGGPYAEYNALATFESVEDARRAVTALERKGVEAGDVELLGPGVEGAGDPVTNRGQRSADKKAMGFVGRRAGMGLAIGAVVGGVIGLVLGLFMNATVGVMGLVGGAIVGAVLGGYWGGGAALPVNAEAWGETFEAVRGGRTIVAVHSNDAGHLDRAVDALRSEQPLRMARFGTDGRLRDV